MNATENMNGSPRVKRESKNRIRVDFERAPLKERLKARFLNLNFLLKVVIYIFRLVFLIGISYVVLYPFITKIAGSFMAPQDFVDVTVRLIPKNFTLDIYRAIFTELGYWNAFINTMFLAGANAIIQVFVCCMIGYGFAKFKFKGRNIIFILVMITMIIPHQTMQLSLFMNFRYFDLYGLFPLLGGNGITVGTNEATGEAIKILTNINLAPHHLSEAGAIVYDGIWTNTGLNLCNTYWPLILLSVTGLGFKNGLYIFLLRQFYRSIPDELEESAYLDGSTPFHTFLTVILPLSIPMMITVFLFSFSWQWTDEFYTGLFFTSSRTKLITSIVSIPESLKMDYAGQQLYYTAIRNTIGICIIMPLVILYTFLQNFIVEGIEHSGLTAD
ncbi:MAG: carbohydrate ABC transporter permease [Clostridia bacterium]|nr:carbohydrate ABC transporter permease [Clostridia bacterium]